MKEGKRSDPLNRRNVLKGVSAAGASIVVPGMASAQGTEKVSSIRFVEAGIEHDVSVIEGDAERLALDSPPKYRVGDGEVVFLDEYLVPAERTRIQQGGTVLGFDGIRTLSSSKFTLSERRELVTETRPDLAPRDGILLADLYRPPSARIDLAGNSVRAHSEEESSEIDDGEEISIKLPTRQVNTRWYEPHEPDQGSSTQTWEKRTGVAEITPKIRVRNHGKMNAHKLVRQSEEGE